MYIGNVILLLLSIPLVGIFVRILRVRPAILAPITALITILGVYTINNSTFDIFVMIAFGIVGYLMKKVGFEPGPMVLAFVLGALLENNVRRSLLIFDGDPTGFVTRPISGTILALRRPGVAPPLVTMASRPCATGASPPRTRPDQSRGLPAMTIVIGYVPSPVGEAALEAGLAEAAARGDDVVILNSPRRRSTVDGELIDETASDELVARAAAAGVTARVDQSDHGDDIVETFTEVAAAAVRPAGRDRPAPPLAGRQARHRQRRPAPAARPRRADPRRQAGPVTA